MPTAARTANAATIANVLRPQERLITVDAPRSPATAAKPSEDDDFSLSMSSYV